jgi:hypothetical protein
MGAQGAWTMVVVCTLALLQPSRGAFGGKEGAQSRLADDAQCPPCPEQQQCKVCSSCDGGSSSSDDQSLKKWLADHRLSGVVSNLGKSVLEELNHLGALIPEDLVDLDQESISGLNLKKLQQKRFARLVARMGGAATPALGLGLSSSTPTDAVTVINDETPEETVAAVDNGPGGLALPALHKPVPVPSGHQQAPRAAFIFAGEAFRANAGSLSDRGNNYQRNARGICSPGSYWRQKGIARSHVVNAIEPFIALGYDVDVFLSYHQCPPDAQAEFNTGLFSWYQNTSVPVRHFNGSSEQQGSQPGIIGKGMEHAMHAAAGGDPSFYDFVTVSRFDVILLRPLPVGLRAAIAGQGLAHPVQSFAYQTDLILAFGGAMLSGMYKQNMAWATGVVPEGGVDICAGLGYGARDPPCSGQGEMFLKYAEGEGGGLRGNTQFGMLPPSVLPSKFLDLYSKLLAAKADFPTLGCWGGSLYMDRSVAGPRKLHNKCTTGSDGKRLAKQQRAMDPRSFGRGSATAFYRTGDCLGLRLQPTNETTGGVVDEFAEAMMTKLAQGIQCNETLDCHGCPLPNMRVSCFKAKNADEGLYSCQYGPGGCQCEMMIAAFGMDPRGCTC